MKQGPHPPELLRVYGGSLLSSWFHLTLPTWLPSSQVKVWKKEWGILRICRPRIRSNMDPKGKEAPWNFSRFVSHPRKTPTNQFSTYLPNIWSCIYTTQGSTFPLYKEIYNNMMNMRPSPFVNSNAEGVERVRNSNGKYAFFMESASIEYQTERDCTLTQLGGLLDSKGYGIALRKSKRRNIFHCCQLEADRFECADDYCCHMRRLEISWCFQQSNSWATRNGKVGNFESPVVEGERWWKVWQGKSGVRKTIDTPSKAYYLWH